MSPQDEWNIPTKINEIISTDDHQEFVLVFMRYYYWFDIDFNLKSLLVKQQYHNWA